MPFIYQAGICCGSNICSPHPCFSISNNRSHPFYRTRSCISIKRQKNAYAFIELLLQQLILREHVNKRLIFLLQDFRLCHCKYLQWFSHHNNSFPFLTRFSYAQLNISASNIIYLSVLPNIQLVSFKI